MKTIKQVAEELGVEKQKVYRYIKNHIIDVHHEAGVMYINDAAETQIKSHFNKNDVHHEAHQTTSKSHQIESHDVVIDAVIDMLKTELENKNKQLEAKDKQLKTQSEQITTLTIALEHAQENIKVSQGLHAGTMQQSLLPNVIDEKPKKRLWDIFKKADA